MFDDKRKGSGGRGGFDDELEPLLNGGSKKRGLQFGSGNFLGMTAVQRFVISVLLFMVVCVLGAMFVMIVSSAAG